MAQLNVGGHTLTVDDKILSLPKEEQEKTIQGILSDSKVQDLLRSGGPTLPPPGMGILESAKEGFMDPFVGLNQFSRHAMGEDTSAVDLRVREREGELERRDIQGVPRFLGSVANPLNLLAAGATEGGSLVAGPLVRAGISAIGGAAGALTEPVTGEDYGPEKSAQVAAGLATGGALGHVGTVGGRTRPALRENVGSAAAGLYDQLARSGAEIDRRAVRNLADIMEGSLRGQLVSPATAPRTFSLIDEIRNLTWLQSPLHHPTIGEFDHGQQALKELRRSPDPQERAAASMALDQMDNWLRNIPQTAIRSGNPARDAATLREAQSLYRVNKRAESIENALREARGRTGSTGYGGNINNVTRQEAGRLLKGAEGRRWSDEDREALQAIREGSFTNNTLRWIGKWAPATPLSGMAAVWEAAKGNYDLAATIAVIGFAAKKGADVGTTRALQEQAARILRGSGFPDRPPSALGRVGQGAPLLSPASGIGGASVADALAPSFHDPLQ